MAQGMTWDEYFDALDESEEAAQQYYSKQMMIWEQAIIAVLTTALGTLLVCFIHYSFVK